MQKVAIIGAGFIGATHAKACSNSKLLDLAAICDTNEETGRKLAGRYGCAYFGDAEAMLSKCDIDIALICLPTFLHKQSILLAAKYGKHIVCEKPVVLTLEEMDEILSAVKEAGVQFMAAQVIRFWPEYVAIKNMYDNGDFGDVKMIYANRLAQQPNWALWHKDPNKSGGGLFDLHLHDIDAVYYMFGPVKRVYAVGWQSRTGCYNHVVSTLTFNNGISAVVEGAWEMSENYPFTMSFRIVGQTKTAEYTMSAGFNLEDIASSRRELYIFENGNEPRRVDIDAEEDAYQSELEYFAGCLESKEPPTIITPEQSREVIRIMLAIRESIETGCAVEL